MQETTLMMPKPVQITQRNEDEISRASVAQHVEPAPLSPQRAHNAFYRSTQEQIASYNPVDDWW